MTETPTSRDLSLGERTVRFWIIRGHGRRVRIVILPDGRVHVHAPVRISETRILAFVRAKSKWIIRTLGKVADYARLPHPVHFISGEMIGYLGRSYPLKIIAGKRGPVELTEDALIVRSAREPSPAVVRRRTEDWLRGRAEETFAFVLTRCLETTSRHGVPSPDWSVRWMKRRWGSCGRDGRVVFNIRLVQTPVECIEYVVMHELCHLKHHNHGGDYYALLTQCMPDWPRRKEALNRIAVM
jgi:hypothetical protein